jgi:hypothetical protein
VHGGSYERAPGIWKQEVWADAPSADDGESDDEKPCWGRVGPARS